MYICVYIYIYIYIYPPHRLPDGVGSRRPPLQLPGVHKGGFSKGRFSNLCVIIIICLLYVDYIMIAKLPFTKPPLCELPISFFLLGGRAACTVWGGHLEQGGAKDGTAGLARVLSVYLFDGCLCVYAFSFVFAAGLANVKVHRESPTRVKWKNFTVCRHRWKRSPLPRPQTFSKLVFLVRCG